MICRMAINIIISKHKLFDHILASLITPLKWQMTLKRTIKESVLFVVKDTFAKRLLKAICIFRDNYFQLFCCCCFFFVEMTLRFFHVSKTLSLTYKSDPSF